MNKSQVLLITRNQALTEKGALVSIFADDMEPKDYVAFIPKAQKASRFKLAKDLNSTFNGCAGTVITLGPSIYKIMRFILQNPWRGLSREMILDGTNMPLNMEDRTIDAFISRLNRKLKKAGIQGIKIESIRGVGYILKIGAEPELEENQKLRIADDAYLDLRSHRIVTKNASKKLTANYFSILAALFEKPGQVKTKESLKRLFTEDRESKSDMTLSVHIGRLRKILEEVDLNPDMIKTVRGEGYKAVLDEPFLKSKKVKSKASKNRARQKHPKRKVHDSKEHPAPAQK